jgi:uncharacterized membrane protein
MKRALLPFAAALVITLALASPVSAAGIIVCNGISGAVAFFLGYVRTKGLESTGRFEIESGKCATFLTDVARGPFYVYAATPDGAMSWNADGKKSAQAFCVSRAPHFVIRHNEYMKDGKLACPDNTVARFLQVPDAPRGTPKFTFTESNSTDRP